MAKNASSQILVAYEAEEKFTAIIRRLKMPAPGAAPLRQLNLELPTNGFGEPEWSDQAHLSRPAAESSNFATVGG